MNLHPSQLKLTVAGLGIVFYSPPAVAHISKGSDFLTQSFSNPQDVANLVRNGELVAFETATPGLFQLIFNVGGPPEDFIERFEFRLELPLIVKAGMVCFRDLYDSCEWRENCPKHQQLSIDDGTYLVTLCSNVPQSGVLGDNQEIQFFFQSVSTIPELPISGIPSLCF